MKKLDRCLYFLLRTWPGRAVLGVVLVCVALFGGVACTCKGGTCISDGCGSCGVAACGGGAGCVSQCGNTICTYGGENCGDCKENSPLCVSCSCIRITCRNNCNDCKSQCQSTGKNCENNCFLCYDCFRMSGCYKENYTKPEREEAKCDYTSCMGIGCDQSGAKIESVFSVKITIDFYDADSGEKLHTSTNTTSGDEGDLQISVGYSSEYEIVSIECGGDKQNYSGHSTSVQYKTGISNGDFTEAKYSGGHESGYKLTRTAQKSIKAMVRRRYKGQRIMVVFTYPEGMGQEDYSSYAVGYGALPDFPVPPEKYDVFPFIGWRSLYTGEIVSSEGDAVFEVNKYVGDHNLTDNTITLQAVYEGRYSVAAYVDLDGEIVKITTLQKDIGDSVASIVAELAKQYGMGETRGKYELQSWSFDEAGQHMYTGSEVLSRELSGTDEVRLYAHYHRVTYNPVSIVLHNVDGPDTGTKTLTTYKEGDRLGDLITEAQMQTTIGKYTFDNWYVNAALTKVLDYDMLPLDGAGTIHYYAKWSEKTTFSVKYYYSLEEYKDGKQNGDLPDGQVEYYKALTLPQGADKQHFVFKGWNLVSKNGTVGTKLYTVTLPAQTVDWDAVLIAVYEHTVRIVPGIDGTLPTGVSQEQTVYFGRKTQLPVPTYKDASKEFSGYKMSGDVMLTDETGMMTEGFTSPTGETTVVAPQWRTATLQVTFRGKDGNVIETKSVEYGDSVTPPDAPVVPGYEFGGWLQDNEPVADEAFTGVTEAMTFTAKYTAKTFTITLDPGDGNTLAVTQVEVTYGEGKGMNLGIPVSGEGKTFIGWQDADGNEYAADNGILKENYTIDGDITLTAIWL